MNITERDSIFYIIVGVAALFLTVTIIQKSVTYDPKQEEINRYWRQEQAKKAAEYKKNQEFNKKTLVGSKILYIGPVTNDMIYIMTDNGLIQFRAEGYKGADLIPEYKLDHKPE